METSSSVDDYIAKKRSWQEALTLLRTILLDTELVEAVKWGAPIYTLNNKNVVGIGAFKSYVGLWFHQGAFLSDPENKLINAQEGKTKGLRQWRFQSAEEIQANRHIIKAYVLEAIVNQKEGKEIKVARNRTLAIPDELKEAFETDSGLKEAFDNFTPGRQREFAEYINEAKRAETRMIRLEKIKAMILKGVGLNDKYR